MFDWFADPAAGLGALFLASLLAATLLPGGSEAALIAFLVAHPGEGAAALFWATLGNTLGGLTSYGAGRLLPARSLERLAHLEQVRRFGSASLLLAWAPLVGDALCVAAGWLRLHWLPCTLFMAAGKAARYWVVAQGTALLAP
jgi:membrane protein YqaA with SNARE-associated domain